MKLYHFDEAQVLYKLNHHLPSQTPLKDFIYHNSLTASQRLKFYEAIFRASEICGCQINLTLDGYRKLYKKRRITDSALDHVLEEHKSSADATIWKQKLLQQSYDNTPISYIGNLRAHWKTAYHIDLDSKVHPILFRILCSYLDPISAFLDLPTERPGLLNSIRTLEVTSSTGLFTSKRAKQLLLNEVQCTIENLLKIIVGKAEYFEEYLFDQQLSHHGWSGIATATQDNPHPILHEKNIILKDAILLELLLEIDNLDCFLGENWQPLAKQVTVPPIDLYAESAYSEHQEVLSLWQAAYEWSYYDEMISHFKKLEITKPDAVSSHSH